MFAAHTGCNIRSDDEDSDKDENSNITVSSFDIPNQTYAHGLVPFQKVLSSNDLSKLMDDSLSTIPQENDCIDLSQHNTNAVCYSTKIESSRIENSNNSSNDFQSSSSEVTKDSSDDESQSIHVLKTSDEFTKVSKNNNKKLVELACTYPKVLWDEQYDKEWHVDSGCSRHMMRRIEYLRDFKSLEDGVEVNLETMIHVP
ncbi:hypothetical protein L1887_07373 [Cichorium endivia]|nr:hypothetical protein L1887_07373 [Cichorium endivia]